MDKDELQPASSMLPSQDHPQQVTVHLEQSGGEGKQFGYVQKYESTKKTTLLMIPSNDEEIMDDIPDITAIETELDRYKCAEAEGRLLVLPCKVGDTVWVTSAYFRVFNSPVEAHLKRIEINGNNSLVPVQLILLMDIGDGYKEYGFNLDGIGKIIFLTREEAEAALSKGEKRR